MDIVDVESTITKENVSMQESRENEKAKDSIIHEEDSSGQSLTTAVIKVASSSPSPSASPTSSIEDEDEFGDVQPLPIIKETPQGKLLRKESVDDELSLKIAVFLKRDRKLCDEGASYILELENGKATTGGEIKLKMLDLLAIPKPSAHLFALWIISPYLELQLKYYHRPFSLRKQWSELLTKYSDCPVEEADFDEPVVVFQRNAFITVAEEEKVADSNVLKTLFEEATFNVLTARYPIPVPDAEMLGGILLRCYEGEFHPEYHKSGVFKGRINDFLPYYAIGSNKISQYLHSSSTEHHLLQQYQSASKKLENQLACYKAFLEYCRNLPFYGAAFFKGTCVQEDADYKIWKSEHLSITVAVNRFGLTLFKTDTEEMLSHLPYDAFSWDHKVDDEVGEDGSITPTERFIIEYDDNGPRQIQVITKQARFMDELGQSCLNFINDSEFSSVSNQNRINRKKLRCISYSAAGLNLRDLA